MDRRTFVLSSATALIGSRLLPFDDFRLRAARPVPSASQLAWQKDEMAMFCHFGVNTFTNREWGDGTEDPTIFAPTNLDCKQWAKTARVAGFRSMILTAKHHDGFCLWPTATTKHSVAASPFRGGKGDVVKEFVDACRAEGLRPGLYLSPWDRNNPAYGDSQRYNDLYCNQLTELLTHYGDIAEVWFDGAKGDATKQDYDWPRFWGLVRRLQPKAIIFSDAGPDVRWCGNESGSAGDPNWSSVDPSIVTFPGASGPAVIPALQHGDPNGSVWRPAEVDVSIRPGWFHHPAEDGKVRTVDGMIQLYISSVGRNGKLLLNVPPTKDGLLHATDVERLAGFGDRLRSMFAVDLASSSRPVFKVTGSTSATIDVDLAKPASVSMVRLSEDIAKGQIVLFYTLDFWNGTGWEPLKIGTTIGHARIQRFTAETLQRMRLTIETAAPPQPININVFA